MNIGRRIAMHRNSWPHAAVVSILAAACTVSLERLELDHGVTIGGIPGWQATTEERNAVFARGDERVTVSAAHLASDYGILRSPDIVASALAAQVSALTQLGRCSTSRLPRCISV